MASVLLLWLFSMNGEDGRLEMLSNRSDHGGHFQTRVLFSLCPDVVHLVQIFPSKVLRPV